VRAKPGSAVRLSHALLVAVLPASVTAQDLSLRAEVDARKVGVEDQLQLELILEGASFDSAQLSPPPLQNLRIVGGPMVSTQVSFVNGVVSQRRVHQYVLQPLAVGKAEVGAARVMAGGVERTTPPLSIEVAAGSVLPRRSRAPDRFGADPFGSDPFGGDPFDSLFGPRRSRGPEPKLFVEAASSRTRLHVGEPLLLTYYLYTQASVTDLRFSEAPQYPGFWSEDLDKPRSSPAGEPATVAGERYRRFPVLQKLLFPTRAGTLTIPGARIRIGVQRGFFDVGDGAVERPTKALAITAEAIPEEPGFSGAVGRFRVSSTLDKDDLAFGEAATLRFRVEGSGNLKWVDRGPELTVSGARVYPPQVKSELKPGPEGISGSKTWEYVVIPETAGSLEVPALSFSYFDPGAGRIVRADTGPLPLRVEAAPGGVSRAAGPAVPAAAPAGTLPLRSDLDLPARRLPEPGGRLLAIAAAAALMLHSAIAAGATWSGRSRPASAGTTGRRSVRSALADLDQAGREGTSKESAAALIEKTLHDLFGEPGHGDGGGGERERAARAVLEEVHFLRYAPQLGDYSEKIREVAARAAEVVRRWA